jgi:hypothetical protein
MSLKRAYLMGKFKVLFEGKNAVVIQLRDGVKAQDLVNEGVLIQREDGLYTKNNKKVIVSESGFFLMSKPRLVNGAGGCGGSVYEVLKSVVISAGHVLECSDILVVGNKSYKLRFKRIRLPRTYPLWVWDVFRLFGYEPYSPYDYGDASIVDYDGGAYNIVIPYPRVVYVAGNCFERYGSNCLGIALATPYMDFGDLEALVDRQLIVDCTYWNYEAIGMGIDIGKVFVSYGGNKYALLKPALLIRFLNQAGIPGCSGSMVYPTPSSYMFP